MWSSISLIQSLDKYHVNYYQFFLILQVFSWCSNWASAMGLCSLRFRIIYLPKFRRYRWKASASYWYIIAPRWIIWSWMWFAEYNIRCNFCMYFSTIRISPNVDVFPGFYLTVISKAVNLQIVSNLLYVFYTLLVVF